MSFFFCSCCLFLIVVDEDDNYDDSGGDDVTALRDEIGPLLKMHTRRSMTRSRAIMLAWFPGLEKGDESRGSSQEATSRWLVLWYVVVVMCMTIVYVGTNFRYC